MATKSKFYWSFPFKLCAFRVYESSGSQQTQSCNRFWPFLFFWLWLNPFVQVYHYEKVFSKWKTYIKSGRKIIISMKQWIHFQNEKIFSLLNTFRFENSDYKFVLISRNPCWDSISASFLIFYTSLVHY